MRLSLRSSGSPARARNTTVAAAWMTLNTKPEAQDVSSAAHVTAPENSQTTEHA